MRGHDRRIYKLFTGKYDISCSVKLQLYSCTGSLSGVETSGNLYKSVSDRSKYELRRHYFSHRIVSVWNSLPDGVVSADSVNSFKSRLDKVWSMHDFVYDYRASPLAAVSCV